MAPTTTKTMPARAPPRVIEESEHLELAQQFKTISDYTSYVISRIQQVNPQLGQYQKPAEELVATVVDERPALTVTPSEAGESQSVAPVAEVVVNNVVDNAVEETEDEPRSRKEKRIKGRRRTANPDTEIEAAFRRQAELKSSFRTLARPLKLVLDEMARRTTETLEAEANAYKTASEHALVEAELRQRLEKRKADVRRQQEMQLEQLRQRHEAEQYTLTAQCKQIFEDAQSRAVDEMAYEMLRIDRQKRIDEGLIEHETDDEDDVILQPHRISYRYNRGDAIEPYFDSRSRRDLEVEHAHLHDDERANMRGILEGEHTVPAASFTIMDATPREAALARRQGTEGLNVLVEASQQIEVDSRKRRRKQIPIMANKDATSLMELANMATKTSGAPHRGDMAPPTTPRRRFSQAGYQDDQLHFYEQRQGHKRSRSDLELSSPATKRAHLDHMSPANLKQEQMTPGSHVYRLADAVAPVYQPEHEYGSPLASAHDQRRRSDFGLPYDRAAIHDTARGRAGELAPLATTFSHPAGYPPPYPDREYRADYARPMMQPPPMPPTAAPVNHFANGNIHRHSFPATHLPPAPPISQWTSITSSPLVALPQGDGPPPAPPPPPPLPYLGRRPSYSIFSQPPPPHHMAGPLHPGPPNQYGGPMLAPAAASLYRAPQPAFQQQADRQEQTKRRNTESNIEKRFRQYQPPTAN